MTEKARRTPLTPAQWAQRFAALGLPVERNDRQPRTHHLSKRQRRELDEITFNKPNIDKTK
jgi:hypothetical protein